jgi:hypothetical protein
MGFVMSGSRKQKKESTDATSRTAGFKVQKAERQIRETELMAKFKEMIEGQKPKE